MIAGNKKPGNKDGPWIIGQTRQCIRDLDRVAETTVRELYDLMLEV
jgi:hypothetical protein